VNRASLSDPRNWRYRSEGAWGVGTTAAGLRVFFLAGWHLAYICSVWEPAVPQQNVVFEPRLVPAPPRTRPYLGGQMRHMHRRRPNGHGVAFGVVFKSLLLSKANEGQNYS